MPCTKPMPAVVLYHANHSAPHHTWSNHGVADLQDCIGEVVELPCNTSYAWHGFTYATCGEG